MVCCTLCAFAMLSYADPHCVMGTGQALQSTRVSNDPALLIPGRVLREFVTQPDPLGSFFWAVV
jgi:hypothetical protein